MATKIDYDQIEGKVRALYAEEQRLLGDFNAAVYCWNPETGDGAEAVETTSERLNAVREKIQVVLGRR